MKKVSSPAGLLHIRILLAFASSTHGHQGIWRGQPPPRFQASRSDFLRFVACPLPPLRGHPATPLLPVARASEHVNISISKTERSDVRPHIGCLYFLSKIFKIMTCVLILVYNNKYVFPLLYALVVVWFLILVYNNKSKTLFKNRHVVVWFLILVYNNRNHQQ